MQYELRTWSRLKDLGPAVFDQLRGAESSPFLSYAWLEALEATGCVSERRGWAPVHITLHREGEVVAFAPAYLKGNSEGEFVFDQQIARYAEGSLGLSYYPKLIVAVPFTPATGPRLLVKPGEPREELLTAFGAVLPTLRAKLGVSSAHVLFPTAEDTELLVGSGLLRRTGLQFQWHNPGYQIFDDFLARFSSKRRNQIRRERRELQAQGIQVEILSGSDLKPELADFVHGFYRSTVDKHFWGRRYLNQAFFEEVLSRMRDQVHLVVAKDQSSGRLIAGAFNLLGTDTLYGRYWGALEDRNFLHFEVCFYRAIEDAIARKLMRFEPGAGGEHKLSRGFEPTPTFSAHHLGDPRLERAVRDFVQREETAIREEIESWQDRGELKPAVNGGPTRPTP